MKLAIGADHAGYPLKEEVRGYLERLGHEVIDLGAFNTEPSDYPDFAEAVGRAVLAGQGERGILICGTGAGMAITANKVPNVRAVTVTDPYTAERAIASNNAQVITLGALITGPSLAKMLVDIWLANQFQGGNSARKVDKIEAARFAT